ncbi:7-cyano-7-deazaguanine/7-aminomethyl-7-deazaguanine transporter [Legionella norrlandica]|uniref:7-cyano-7-deazaguanine/7-aminomethyl-7- deazaguanine transporter n=1 Tax=Legionella norrlandica TaxID=1498499 RepID=UPI000559F204|nr:7-cyano-7-deazaguanine/7-aminomethyl-7-deazaguanine transporter [Legionella norrlandica]
MLSISHILLLTISNILVQYPFEIFGYHTTWGAITYPAIFILTDITTRILSADIARKIIFRSMLPGLFISYIIASYMETHSTFNWSDLLIIHPMPLRIALASFLAYTVGQFLDIFVFQSYRNYSSWWLAPSLSTTVGNLIDTILFFTVAFYHCSNPFLNQHWPEIAAVDMLFKITISLIAFVPIYGFVLNILHAKYLNKIVT